jgi:hypothetical protein
LRFEKRLRDGISDGSISTAFRRWRRPQVVAGRRYRTGEGMVEMDSVDVVEEDEEAIDDEDVKAAGFSSRQALLAELQGSPDLPLYRLRFHRVDTPDPRSVLANDDNLGPDDAAAIAKRLERLDRASSHGPWTAAVLECIAANPGVRAPDLAASFDREVLPFKLDVRKLKELGLTLSLRIGYQLSPRGQAYLRASS